MISVRVTAYAQEGNGPVTKVAQAIDKGQLKQYDPDTPYVRRMGDAGPIDQLRIDNWPEPPGFQTKQVHGVISGPYGG